jgi:hypothetical protein
VLLVAEGDDAHAGGLREAAEIGDRDAGHAVDVGDAVELQRVDDEVEAVGLLALVGLAVATRKGLDGGVRLFGDSGAIHGDFLRLGRFLFVRAPFLKRVSGGDLLGRTDGPAVFVRLILACALAGEARGRGARGPGPGRDRSVSKVPPPKNPRRSCA